MYIKALMLVTVLVAMTGCKPDNPNLQNICGSNGGLKSYTESYTNTKDIVRYECNDGTKGTVKWVN